jgi:hypothetical protein
MSDQPRLVTSPDKFYSHLSNKDFDALGILQWQALRDIEAQYDTMPMTQFQNVPFSSNTWPLTDNSKCIQNIHWHKVLLKDNSNFPWVLLLKLSLYQRIEQQKFSLSSYGSIITFALRWTPYLKDENILVSTENRPFIPARIITKDMLHSWFVENIEHSPFRDISQILHWSKLIKSTSHSLPEKASVLKTNFELPWRNYKQNNQLLPAQQYINDLLGDEATRMKISSYQSFSSVSISALLDIAIPVFTKNAPALIDLFKTFKKHYPQGRTKTELINDKNFYQDAYMRAMETFTTKHKTALNSFPELRKSLNDQFYGISAGNYNFGLRWLYDLHQQCIGAATWIIMLTTALRNIDVRTGIMRDCVVPDPDGELLNYLVTDIQKVSLKNYPIPIPPITMEAITFLNNINFAPNIYGKNDYSPYLISRLFVIKGKENWHYQTGDQLNNALRAFAKGNGIDLLDGLEDGDNSEGVAHRCRVTMAEWIGTNSPLAVMIVKRLFAHTNEIMPDNYLKSNRAVMTERARIQNETYEDLSDGISEAIVDNKFSGGLKDKIKSDVAEIKIKLVEDNESLIGDELRQTLKHHIKKVLFERLKNGDSLGLQTPLGFICMRNPSSTESAPCSGKTQNIKMDNADIDKRFMRALQVSTLPDLDNCQGSRCKHSLLYDDSVTQLLLETFHYYVNYLKGVGQFNVDHSDIEAENFIKLYYPSLKDIYPEIEKELDKLELN